MTKTVFLFLRMPSSRCWPGDQPHAGVTVPQYDGACLRGWVSSQLNAKQATGWQTRCSYPIRQHCLVMLYMCSMRGWMYITQFPLCKQGVFMIFIPCAMFNKAQTLTGFLGPLLIFTHRKAVFAALRVCWNLRMSCMWECWQHSHRRYQS